MEITANAIQTVNTNQNILFNETAVKGNCSIIHREGSGLVTLRGLTQQCYARFKISFGANIQLPEGGTVEPISLAIAVNGESIPTASMIYTPAAIEQFGNVYASVFLNIPAGCCSQVSVENISTQAINVQNANLIIERVA